MDLEKYSTCRSLTSKKKKRENFWIRVANCDWGGRTMLKSTQPLHKQTTFFFLCQNLLDMFQHVFSKEQWNLIAVSFSYPSLNVTVLISHADELHMNSQQPTCDSWQLFQVAVSDRVKWSVAELFLA